MSCNDICLSVDYDGESEFYNTTKRRAAKSYKCCECGDTIGKGEQYEYASGKFDGYFWYDRTCLACAEIATAYFCGGREHSTLWERIRDDMLPRWNEMTAIDCLAKLTSDAAIAKMRDAHARYVEDRA